jgi:hydrogenase expression/formation protein HypC
MCLAIPVRVVELLRDEAAIVDLSGIRKEISLALVDGVQIGDYVILHVGYALAKLDAEEAERTLELFRQSGLSLPPLEGEGKWSGAQQELSA